MKNHFEEIKVLIEIVEVIEGPTPEGLNGYERIGLIGKCLIYKNESYQRYLEVIKNIYLEEDEINSKLSLKVIKEKIIEFIYEHKIGNIKITKNDTDILMTTIASLPLQHYSVFTDVFGIYLEKPSQVFVQGIFKFYYWPQTKGIIESKTKLNPMALWMTSVYDYLIEVEVDASDNDKAIELASVLFEKWQYFMHVVIGNTNKENFVAINDRKLLDTRQYLLISNQTVSSSNTMVNFNRPIPIDDISYYTKKENGFDKIWSLLSINSKNKLQRRIALSIEWLGQAYRDSLPQNMFLKAAISLEIIFTYQEETIITPSILSQISESVALILGHDADTKLAIEQDVKKLYGKRSSIVHAGSNNIDSDLIHKILAYSRYVILRLLNDDEYNKLTSIESLYEYLKRKKYSN